MPLQEVLLARSLEIALHEDKNLVYQAIGNISRHYILFFCISVERNQGKSRVVHRFHWGWIGVVPVLTNQPQMPSLGFILPALSSVGCISKENYPRKLNQFP